MLLITTNSVTGAVFPHLQPASKAKKQTVTGGNFILVTSCHKRRKHSPDNADVQMICTMMAEPKMTNVTKELVLATHSHPLM
jgi:hypothetical protein